VTVTIDEASQTVQPGGSTEYTVRVLNSGGLDASYSVEMTGTAVGDPTVTVSPLNWNTGTPTPGAEHVQVITVSTSGSTPETTYTLTATATCQQEPAVSDAATSQLIVSSQSNVLAVDSVVVELTERTAGKNTFVGGVATVQVVDGNGQPVAGASVSGHWSGATTDTDSGTTGADGTVVLYSDEVKNPGSGTKFTFTVDDVSKTGWTYDPSLNNESADEIPVQ
jgi:hypothetical protein